MTDETRRSSRHVTNGESDMATTTNCTHPDVWDFEHSDGMRGMNGTDHTVECAQAHIDRALKVWGMDGDVRWVVDRIEVHDGGVHDGEHHDPFTVAYGYYEEVAADGCAICGKRLVLPDGSLACACGALAATDGYQPLPEGDTT